MSNTSPEIGHDRIINRKTTSTSYAENIQQRDSTMPSVVIQEQDDDQESQETVFKIEPGTEIVRIETDSGHETDPRPDTAGYMGEEPLEIQCGENAALLYVSKLCQGSKGPCILFNNEWLTPNELQYISGRETAKDWKRSIRFKGKSLKSLIARGLIKVHPPICDCLGCRISSPVNRGRLASKCGVPPPSPRSRKRDTSKSFSCWSHEELESATTHRHFSTSDLENCTRHSLINGFREARPGSYSSTASESSDAHDESPFSPVTKRSHTPDLSSDERGRLSSNQFNSYREDYDKALSIQRMIQLNQEQDSEPNKEQIEDNETDSSKTRSAFRTVQQDTLPSMTPTITDNEPKEMSSRTANKVKQKPSSGPSTPPFLPTYTQYPSSHNIVGPTSPRLVPDPLIFANPHNTNLYHHAFRGGFHGVPQIPRNLMQYRLLNPPGTGNTTQSPLAGLTIQGQLQMMQDFAAVNGAKIYDQKRLIEDDGIPRKRRRSSVDNSDEKSSNSVFSDDDASSPNKENGHHDDKSNHVSVIHKSPVHSPLTVDVDSDTKTGSESSPPCRAHRLIPKLKLKTDEEIVNWTVDEVCDFISSLTGSTEIVNEFKDQCIDGQSLILLKEEHLLNKLGIKLGPALKILAHIQKLLERIAVEVNGINCSDTV